MRSLNGSGDMSKKKESKYPRDELINNSQAIFGVKPEVVVGALYGNSAEELTKSEVQAAIKKFLGRKAK